MPRVHPDASVKDGAQLFLDEPSDRMPSTSGSQACLQHKDTSTALRRKFSETARVGTDLAAGAAEVAAAMNIRGTSSGHVFQRDIRFTAGGTRLFVGSLHTTLPLDMVAAYLEQRADLTEKEKEKTFLVLQELEIKRGEGIPHDVFCSLFATEDTIDIPVLIKVFMHLLLFPLTFIGILFILTVKRKPGESVVEKANAGGSGRLSKLAVQLHASYFLPLERLLATFGWQLWDDKIHGYRKPRRLIAALTWALTGWLCAVYAALAGFYRGSVWFSIPRMQAEDTWTPVKSFNRGAAVEALFPVLILVYFCGQVALCFDRYQGKFSKVVQRSNLARNLHAHRMRLSAPVDLGVCVVQLPLDTDGACDSCGLCHSEQSCLKQQGDTVDLLAHLMCNQQAYASSHWKLSRLWDNVFAFGGACILAFIPMFIRVIKGGGYSGERSSASKTWFDWVDTSIVVCSQIALLTIFGLYFYQLCYIRRAFMGAVFWMKMLTNMVLEESHIFTECKRIISLPFVSLIHTENVITWYQLRRYVQLLGNQQVQQMEMVVIIISLAIIMFMVIVIAIIILGLTTMKGLQMTLMALQAMSVIVAGAVLQALFLFQVLMVGAEFNDLQAKHASVLAAAQMEINLQMDLQNLDSVENAYRRQAESTIEAVRRNLKNNDELFGLFGVALNKAMVNRIIGIGLTLGTTLLSFVGSYISKQLA